MKQGWFYNYENLKRQFVALKRYYPFYFDKFSSFDDLRDYFSKNLYSPQCDALLEILFSLLKKKIVTFEFLYILFEKGINKILFKYSGFPEKDDLEIFLFEIFIKVVLRFDFDKHKNLVALRIISKLNKQVCRYVKKYYLLQSKVLPLEEENLKENFQSYSLDLILEFLSDFDKQLIIRRYVYGESVKHIAESLNRSYSSIKKRIQRAIKKIKKIF